MGIYVYTLRKRKQTFYIDGEPYGANLFDYAYKPFSSFSEPSWHRAMTARANAAAERAFESYEGGYVILGGRDDENKIAAMHGALVFTGVTSATYVDSGKFPGFCVGILIYDGKRLNMVVETEWDDASCGRFDGEREFRQAVRDGQYKIEGRFKSDGCPIIPGETVDKEGKRIVEENYHLTSA